MPALVLDAIPGKKERNIGEQNSLFLQELQSIPVVGALEEIYTTTRDKHWILKKSLGLFEDSITRVLSAVSRSTDMVDIVDKSAGECLAKVKTRYPELRKSPDEVYESSKTTAILFVRRGAKTMLRTSVGQTFVRGLDWTVDASERLLQGLKTQKNNVGTKTTQKKTKSQSPRKEHKDHAYASEDSGVHTEIKRTIVTGNDSPNKALRHRGQQTKLTAFVSGTASKKDTGEKDGGLLKKILQLAVVFPLELLVVSLKFLQKHTRSLSGRSRKRRQGEEWLSPEKKAEISSRRKVSPRKKVTFFGSLKHKTCNILGLKDQRFPVGISDGSASDTSPNSTEKVQKRKHDEILTENDSDDSEGFQNFDFDAYESEEDPDYSPADSAEDSYEYKEGDTESDIEVEELPEKMSTGQHCQIKEKTAKGSDPAILKLGQVIRPDVNGSDVDGLHKEKPKADINDNESKEEKQKPEIKKD